MEQRQSNAKFRIKRHYMLAQGNLVLERLWDASRVFLCVIGLFLSLTFVGFWEFLNPYAHLVFLTAFMGALAFGLKELWTNFHRPTEEEVLASLEERNNFQHRPLRSLSAIPVLEAHRKNTPKYLWQLYQKQTDEIVRNTKAGWPRINFASGDTYSLRSVVILLVIAGFFVGGAGAEGRLPSAFSINLTGNTTPVEIDVWTTPPEYTRLPPKLLARMVAGEGDAEPLPISLPSGSKIIARVSGGNLEVPILRYGERDIEFLPAERTNFELEIILDQSALIHIEKDGDSVISWQVSVIPDASPNAVLATLPEVTDRSAFRLHYNAADDYGVIGLTGKIIKKGNSGEIILKLPIVTGAKEVGGKSYHDLTAHPWAGFPVELVLVAKDELEQEGKSRPVSFMLPERTFTHPIARVLIEQRKKLVEDPAGQKESVAIALSAIGTLPESLNNDFIVIMMLSVAKSTLVYGDDASSVDDVISILWDTALRLENGDLNAAEIALREAERALMEALNNDASDQEIKKLVEELRTAMNNFLKALSQNQVAASDRASSQSQQVDQKDLESLLDKVDRFARFGARDAARELLGELQDILENLRSASAMPPSSSQSAGQEMLNQLDELMGRQQNLLDKTFRQSHKKNSPNSETSDQRNTKNSQRENQRRKDFSDLAGQQEALRQMLGDLMAQMGLNGKIPDTLGNAERSMNEARQELEIEDGNRAAEAQSKALDQLRESAKGIAEQLMQGNEGEMIGSGQNGSGQDPLGRFPSDPNGTIRDEGARDRLQENAISRARLIQDELRRRLSNPSRNKLERDYLLRLIERFR